LCAQNPQLKRSTPSPCCLSSTPRRTQIMNT
jgi:hypothetical protein